MEDANSQPGTSKEKTIKSRYKVDIYIVYLKYNHDEKWWLLMVQLIHFFEFTLKSYDWKYNSNYLKEIGNNFLVKMIWIMCIFCTPWPALDRCIVEHIGQILTNVEQHLGRHLADMSNKICRLTYRPRYLAIVGWYVDLDLATILVDTSVDMSTGISWMLYRLSVDRYVSQHIGWGVHKIHMIQWFFELWDRVRFFKI